MKQVQRKCIGTKKIKDTSEMIRVVKTNTGEFIISSDVKGRGAYISKEPSIVNQVIKKRILHKVFKANVPKKIYDELHKHI